MTTIETIRDITLTAKIAHRIERETKAELARLKLQKATIEFCENYVENEILTSATEGIECVYLPVLGRAPWSDDDEWYPLIAEKRRYANGEESLIPNRTKPAISITYLTKYLQSRGFTVSIENRYYMNYGCGQQKGHRIRISW